MAEEESRSFEHTPTWVVTVVCSVFVLLSFLAERGLHRLGKFLKHKKQDSLYDALEKVKEELMLVGFFSVLLTVFQSPISKICVPANAENIMLPCKLKTDVSSGGSKHLNITKNRGRLLAEDTSMEHCARMGELPLISQKALHQLQIFIFVLVVVHVIFCVTTMLLGRAKIWRWKHWENSIRSEMSKPLGAHSIHVHHRIFMERAGKYGRKFSVVSWIVSFFKQFYGPVTKSDYITLRAGFIRAHCPRLADFDFHNYMLRTLARDFKKIVGISWYMWVFVMIFLLIDLAGWHSYFWLSFLPLMLLVLVGAKLEHIITQLARKVAERRNEEADATAVRPSDELFWFHSPTLYLYLIHFILFQNAFEIAFLFWAWSTYGFRSCIMEGLGFIIPRLAIGITVQVLCGYRTLPLYAIVTQMGSMFKQGMFDAHVEELILGWAQRRRTVSTNTSESNALVGESVESIYVAEQPTVDEGITASVIELTHQNESQITFS